ncbi:MAG: lipopolysaccharide kinase InaA family protein [Acidobacteriota bacterium]
MVVNFYKNCDFEISESVLVELLKIYEEKEALPSGRGTSKLIEYKGKNYILKKESRGGLFSSFLPRDFFRLQSFFKEVEISKVMEKEGLTIPIFLRFGLKHNILWKIYTLTPYIVECLSLKDIALKDNLEREKVFLAGKIIAKMHKIGIFHSDLNLGNIIFDRDKAFLIDFKNSYIYDSPLNKTLSKKNILRVLRSYLKETARVKKELNKDFLKALLDGYSSENKEDWANKISFDTFSIKLHALTYKIRF